MSFQGYFPRIDYPYGAITLRVEHPKECYCYKVSTPNEFPTSCPLRNVMPLFTPSYLEEGYYKDVLENIGFQVVLCERNTVQSQFLDDESFLREILIYARVQFKLREDLLTRFKEESISLFKELIGYSGSGPLCYEDSELLLLAIKPQDGKNLDKFL
ncbi:hypothetical protein TNCV_1953361 [Trichonephila clavipes]|nr:hypothetical protein TNCV_1953361 [Trichonephila clavipes]